MDVSASEVDDDDDDSGSGSHKKPSNDSEESKKPSGGNGGGNSGGGSGGSGGGGSKPANHGIETGGKAQTGDKSPVLPMAIGFGVAFIGMIAAAIIRRRMSYEWIYVGLDGKYYDKRGNVVDKDDYEEMD